PNRRIHLAVGDTVLAERRAAMQARGEQAWQPVDRERAPAQQRQGQAAAGHRRRHQRRGGQAG
ncbi:hypothetical protein, partial [Bordetella pertussis]|uniref:hypothetical protein n=1 Tax=Bordetella pertussis TaxID=520 RepID=UPI003CC8D37F